MHRAWLRYPAIFVSVVFLFVWVTYRDSASYRQDYRDALMTYQQSQIAKMQRLSGVNFYWYSTRRSPGYLGYRPNGRHAFLQCIRCEIKWSKIRKQIGEVDYVTVGNGEKIILQIRLKSGKILLSRQQALAQLNEVVSLSKRKATDPLQRYKDMILSIFFGLVVATMATCSEALQRHKERKLTANTHPARRA